MANTKPLAPSITSVTGVTTSSVTVKWKAPASNGADIDGYKVRYSSTNFATYKTDVISSNIQFDVITGLARNKEYSIKITAYNSTWESESSSVVKVTTLADLPTAPRPKYIDAQGRYGIHYLFDAPADNGGGSILDYQVGFSTDSSNKMQNTVSSTGDSFINGLTPGTTYYVWVRARNVAGWSPWSSQSQITTDIYAPFQTTPTFIGNPTQHSLHYVFTVGDNGGSPVLETQVGYSTDPNSVDNTVDAPLDSIVNNLSPGTIWYVWSRQRNAQGWGTWSARSEARTVAGAKVNDNGVWRDAIPYVNDNGTWKLAQPYAKSVGLWKKSV